MFCTGSCASAAIVTAITAKPSIPCTILFFIFIPRRCGFVLTKDRLPPVGCFGGEFDFLVHLAKDGLGACCVTTKVITVVLLRNGESVVCSARHLLRGGEIAMSRRIDVQHRRTWIRRKRLISACANYQ